MYSAFLTPQGKFLHDFFLLDDDAGVLLECEAPRATDLAARLSRYRLRAKVEVTVPDPAPRVFAVYGDGAAAAFALPAVPGSAARHPHGIVFVDPRVAALGVRIVADADAPVAKLTPPGGQAADPTEYDTWRLHLGVPDGSRDLEVEKSTLLEGNVDHLNGIDWDKGCYLGQELTARMHYRGLLKRRLVPFAVSGETPAPGTPVHRDGRQVGTVKSSHGDAALALVEIAALDGTLAAGPAALRVIKPAWAEFLAAPTP